MWIYTNNKRAKFHWNILSLSENIAKSFRGLLFWLTLYSKYRSCCATNLEQFFAPLKIAALSLHCRVTVMILPLRGYLHFRFTDPLVTCCDTQLDTEIVFLTWATINTIAFQSKTDHPRTGYNHLYSPVHGRYAKSNNDTTNEKLK